MNGETSYDSPAYGPPGFYSGSNTTSLWDESGAKYFEYSTATTPMNSGWPIYVKPTCSTAQFFQTSAGIPNGVYTTGLVYLWLGYVPFDLPGQDELCQPNSPAPLPASSTAPREGPTAPSLRWYLSFTVTCGLKGNWSLADRITGLMGADVYTPGSNVLAYSSAITGSTLINAPAVQKTLTAVSWYYTPTTPIITPGTLCTVEDLVLGATTYKIDNGKATLGPPTEPLSGTSSSSGSRSSSGP